MKMISSNTFISAIKDLATDRKRLVKILLVVLILVTAAFFRGHEQARADISVDDSGSGEYSADLYVDIGGAVVKPGVYKVTGNTRLYEVIEMAGGLTSAADTDSINRAAFVEDGEKIIIPVRYAVNNARGEELYEGLQDEQADISDGTSYSQGSDSGLININTATAEELKTLNGIGDAIAGRIIEYRTGNRFKNIEDIKEVKGIGDGVFNKIKDHITI